MAHNPSYDNGNGTAAVPRPRVRWVVTQDPDGLADRLVNAVTAFYFALLTDRVLCIRPAGPGQPGLEEALGAPNIEYTCRCGWNRRSTGSSS